MFRSRDPTRRGSGEPNIVGSTLQERFFFQLLYPCPASPAKSGCWRAAQAAPSPRQSSKPGTMRPVAHEQSNMSGFILCRCLELKPCSAAAVVVAFFVFPFCLVGSEENVSHFMLLLCCVLCAFPVVVLLCAVSIRVPNGQGQGSSLPGHTIEGAIDSYPALTCCC